MSRRTMRAYWNELAVQDPLEAILTGYGHRLTEFRNSGEDDARALSRYADKSATVLDLGCGIGRVARELSRHVKTIHAVDVSDVMIAKARVYCAGINNIEFHRVEDSLQCLPDMSIDFAFALLALQHLPQKVCYKYFRELQRVLGVRRSVVFSVPIADRETPRGDGDLFAGRGFTVSEVEALLDPGFVPVSVRELSTGRHPWPVRKMLYHVRKR